MIATTNLHTTNHKTKIIIREQGQIKNPDPSCYKNEKNAYIATHKKKSGTKKSPKKKKKSESARSGPKSYFSFL